MRKSTFKRILAALCAGMVMGAGTGLSPVLAEDMTEDPSSEMPEVASEETPAVEATEQETGEEATEADTAAAPAEAIPFEEKDADQLAHEKAVEMTASMELRQKIAQMIIVNIRYWSNAPEGGDDPEQTVENVESERIKQTDLNNEMKTFLEKYDFGGVLLFADNLTGTEQTTRFTAQLQEAASNTPDGIPFLIAADQEGGRITRLGTGTSNCGNMALGATGNPDYAYDSANIIGKELNAVGINTDFAPVMDVNNNPKNPIIGIRSFSSDAQIVSRMGLSYIEGLNDNNIVSTVKHFPGHGDTATDSHTGLPLVDRSYDELKERELIPFQAAFDNDVDMVMTAHIQYPQIESGTYTSISTGEEIYLPATLSKTILTDIVREDMDYQGVIVTDGMQMGAMTQNYDLYDTAVLAINAGVDMLLEPITSWSPEDIEAMEAYLDNIEEAVSDGTIPESRIDESCTRILELKYKRGLFEENTDDVDIRVEKALSVVGSKENHDQEMEIALRGITLVQNNDNVLPLRLNDDESVAFFYPGESVKNSFVYAFDQLKSDGTVPENADAAYNCYDGRSAESFRNVIEGVKAVVISAETWNEGDMDPSTDDEHPENMAKFIDEMTDLAHSMGKKVIVLSMFLPYDVARYTAADAVLAGYGSKRMPVIPEEYNGELATYGPNYPAAVMTVFGANNPTGKLPVTVYKLDDTYHYTDEEQYAIGYGLEYTEPETASDDISSSSGSNTTNKNNDKNKGAPKTSDRTPYIPIGIVAAAAVAALGTVFYKSRKDD